MWSQGIMSAIEMNPGGAASWLVSRRPVCGNDARAPYLHSRCLNQFAGKSKVTQQNITHWFQYFPKSFMWSQGFMSAIEMIPVGAASW